MDYSKDYNKKSIESVNLLRNIFKYSQELYYPSSQFKKNTHQMNICYNDVENSITKLDEFLSDPANQANIKNSFSIENLFIELKKIKSIIEIQENQSYELEFISQELIKLTDKLNDNMKIIEEIFDKISMQANIDGLTGLFNHRFLQEYFENLLLKHNKNNLYVCFCDLDNFKTINDTYGHKFGDEVLKTVASTLKDHVGEEGFCSRYGGEEFIILTHSTDIVAFVKSLQVKIHDLQITFNKETVQPTISIGLSEYPVDGTSKEELIQKADKAMYYVKVTGKDNYQFYDDSIHGVIKSDTICAGYYKTIYSTLFNISANIDKKDEYKEGHSDIVAEFSKSIAKRMNLSDTQVNIVYLASYLRDIGKSLVSEELLRKKGVLSMSEKDKIQNHTLIGYEIVKDLMSLDEIPTIIKHHHERYDGSGYPDKLSGQHIPLLSRIINVSEAFCAMMNERPYRKALSKEEIIEEFIKNKSNQFDPHIVDILLEIIKEV